MDYKQFVGHFFKDHETQSRDMELQGLLSVINTKGKVDYQTRFEKSIRAREGALTEEEIDQMKKDEVIMREKILAAEKTKVYVNFFNRPALRLIKNSKYDTLITNAAPSEILSELAIRAFTGSRDVPKDNVKAMELFMHSEVNAKTDSEHLHVTYY